MNDRFLDLKVRSAALLIWVCAILVNATLGTMSVNYLFVTIAHRHIAQWQAVLAGIFLGELTVPLAVLVFLLEALGIRV